MEDKTTTIFLIRHGQTFWNDQKRWQGCQNSNLTALGIEQAYQTKEIVGKYHIQSAYVSPLQRAKDTIKIILEDKEIKINILDAIKEINLGPWEGKTQEETSLSNPKEFNHFWKAPELFSLAGAETFQELQNRVVNGLDYIFSQHEGETILVVSHWISIKVALAYYNNQPLSSLPAIENPKNAQLLRITKTGSTIKVN